MFHQNKSIRAKLSGGSSAAALIAGALLVAAACTLSAVAFAQNSRGSATGPTTAPGFDHPDQYLHVQDRKACGQHGIRLFSIQIRITPRRQSLQH